MFASQGSLSGSTGCNSFSGTYTSSGSSLSMKLGAMTQKACGAAALQAQEHGITTQLPSVTTYHVASAVLTLSGSGGSVLFTYRHAATGLTGSTWRVTGVNNGKGAVESTSATNKLTARFAADDSFHGFGGCNEMSGPYKLTGAGGLSIGPLAATKKACEQAVDQLEAQYNTALGHVAAYEIAGSTLTLRDTNGATQVTAARQ